MFWTPTIGTGLIDEFPFYAYQTGKYLDIPIISGVNRDEGILFVYSAFTAPLPRWQFDIILPILLGPENAQAIIKHYNLEENHLNDSDYRNFTAQLATDAFFHCPNRNVSVNIAQNFAKKSARQHLSDSNLANYVYHFNHVSSFTPQVFSLPACYTKVCVFLFFLFFRCCCCDFI